MTEALARYWLTLGDLGSQVIRRIMDTYGSALAFYDDRERGGPLLGAPWKRMKAFGDPISLLKGFQDLEEAGVAFLTPQSEHWPGAFSRLEDPPAGLYCLGNTALLLSERIFTLVGTRRPTVYGRKMTRAIARDLALEGCSILSGFALGVDEAAHEGSLEAGCGSIAILGCGLDVDYPSGSAGFRRRILESGGLILTEHPMGSRPLAGHFPQRNRLLAGLCHGLMVTEGSLRSGSLISARLAAEMGNEVFALPGSVDSSMSAAPHALIRDGARLAANAGDILEDMGWRCAPKEEKPLPSGPEGEILKLLEREPLSFDQLIYATGWTAQELNACLSLMEIGGLIDKAPGRVYSKA